jgi:hypothetical protein
MGNKYASILTLDSCKFLPINYQLIRKVYYTKEEMKRFNMRYSAQSKFHQTTVFNIFEKYKPIINLF